MRNSFRVIVLSAFILSGCSSNQSTPTGQPTPEQIHNAIGMGAQYLAEACKQSGEFVYLDHLDPSVEYGNDYNELRHAGALYPMGEYFVRYKRDPKIKAAMVRAAQFFVQKYVAPVPDTNGKNIPGVLGSWSVPADENRGGDREVKLGGIGLGLVGLLETERVAPGTTPLPILRGLANCLVFLQEPDGSFCSKYNHKQGGKMGKWDSLYYPGEAALGLAMLYELDPDPKQKTKWLNTAFKGLGFLASSRRGMTSLPADHWALIATAKLWPYYPASDQSVPRHLILEHAVNLCRTLLRDRDLHSRRTTPVATRLEGLLAILEVLSPEQDALKQQITEAVQGEIARLVECQVKDGELSGAIPRDFAARPPASGEKSSTLLGGTDRGGEVRIDYIQHAISAMMSYDRLVLKATSKTTR